MGVVANGKFYDGGAAKLHGAWGSSSNTTLRGRGAGGVGLAETDGVVEKAYAIPARRERRDSLAV